MNGNTEEEEAILRSAEYERMPLDSSVTLARVAEGGHWEKTDVIHVYFAEPRRVCKVTKNTFGPSFYLASTAGVLRVRNSGRKKRHLEAQFITATAGMEYSILFKGGHAKLTLAGGNFSGVNYHLGIGVSTCAGVKDDSVYLRLFGCGFSVGQRIGLSVLDNEFALDFGKFKPSNSNMQN